MLWGLHFYHLFCMNFFLLYCSNYQEAIYCCKKLNHGQSQVHIILTPYSPVICGSFFAVTMVYMLPFQGLSLSSSLPAKKTTNSYLSLPFPIFHVLVLSLLCRDENPYFSENVNDFLVLECSNMNLSVGYLRISSIFYLTTFPVYFLSLYSKLIQLSHLSFTWNSCSRQDGFFLVTAVPWYPPSAFWS